MAADIVILSKDETFCRMLEIELTQKEFTVQKSKSGVDFGRNVSGAKMAIIDLSHDDCLRIIKYFSDIPCIFAGFENEIPKELKNRELSSREKIFVRPFFTEELLDFVQKTLGRKTVVTPLKDAETAPFDELEINEPCRKVYFRGDIIRLTKREYELLLYLVQNKGIICSRNDIFEKVWGFDYIGDTNVVDVYIRYLRQKIDEKYDVRLIATARGAGYAIGI